ncbi:MAG: hypothetical protein KKB59_18965 [Spirochaetes bacterium]|nr:hypothetical protein [Spirochaetota bacterium]
MGNHDLVIGIAGYAFIVRGSDYNHESDAVNMAMAQFKTLMESIRKEADYPQDIRDEFSSIDVFQLVN